MRRLLAAVLFLVLLVASFVHLDSAPPIWWDEGWNLALARTWLVKSYYGQINNGEIVSADLAGAFTVIAPAKASFQLLGTGIWQARILNVFLAMGTVLISYTLASRLFNKQAALTAIFFIVTAWRWMNVLYWGRQFVGEVPALFYALCGYLLSHTALRKSALWVLPAGGFWGLAMVTKVQTMAFLYVSVILVILIALVKRSWRAAALLFLQLLIAYAVSLLMVNNFVKLLGELYLPRLTLPNVVQVTALVTKPEIRLVAVVGVILLGLPGLIALTYSAIRYVKELTVPIPLNNNQVIQLALFFFSGGWFAWYIFLSIGWHRYLFPPVFVSNIFIGLLVSDLYNRFQIQDLVYRLHSALPMAAIRTLTLKERYVILALPFIVILAVVGLVDHVSSYLILPEETVKDVAVYLNTNTPPDSLIESYESELFFFLDRRFHFPPAHLQTAMLERITRDNPQALNYDALAFDPDYLVIGPFSKYNNNLLYAPFIDAKLFSFKIQIGDYTIYERTR